jgi:hypothetical protein
MKRQVRGSRARLRHCITLCDFATLRETCFCSRKDAKTQRKEEAGCGEVEQDSDIALLFATSQLCVKHVFSHAKTPRRKGMKRQVRGSRARLRHCITLCDFATLRETRFSHAKAQSREEMKRLDARKSGETQTLNYSLRLRDFA